MNKKGIENYIGMIVIVAVAVIVGLVLLQQSATNVATLTSTVDVVNQSVTGVATGSSFTLSGQAVKSVVIANATNGTSIPSSNYTINNYVVSNGQLISTITNNGGTGMSAAKLNVSYTYEPYGYDTNGGGRAIAGLIIVFFALSIATVVIVVVIKNDVFNF